MLTSTKKLMFLLLIPLSGADGCGTGCWPKKDRQKQKSTAHEVMLENRATDTKPKVFLETNKAKKDKNSINTKNGNNEANPIVTVIQPTNTDTNGQPQTDQIPDDTDAANYKGNNFKGDIDDEDKNGNHDETTKTTEQKGILARVMQFFKRKGKQDKNDNLFNSNPIEDMNQAIDDYVNPR